MFRFIFLRTFWPFVAAVLALRLSPAWADPFDVVRLDSLPAGSHVVGINNHRELVGFVYADDETRPGAFFLNRNGQLIDLGVYFTDALGRPDQLQMVRLNNSGQVFALVHGGAVKVFNQEGSILEVTPPFETDSTSSVTLGSANDQGQFILSRRREGEGLEAFYFYDPVKGFRRILLDGLVPYDEVANAQLESITDSGLVYGAVQLQSSDRWLPVEYDPEEGSIEVITIPGLPGSVEILAVSDSGRFLIEEVRPGEVSPQFMTYDFGTAATTKLVPSTGAGSIGSIRGSYREDRINSAGALVGFTTANRSTLATGFSPDSKTVYDLNCLLSPAKGLRVTDISGITESGVLLVSAISLAKRGAVEPFVGRQVLLVPNGEPFQERYCARLEVQVPRNCSRFFKNEGWSLSQRAALKKPLACKFAVTVKNLSGAPLEGVRVAAFDLVKRGYSAPAVRGETDVHGKATLTLRIPQSRRSRVQYQRFLFAGPLGEVEYHQDQLGLIVYKSALR